MNRTRIAPPAIARSIAGTVVRGAVIGLGLGLALGIEAGAARAATWDVTPDPSQPEDRVGAVVAQASSGDTVRIAPGTYYEHVALDGKSLVFLGTSGAESTILDGSRAIAGRAGSIFYRTTDDPAGLTIHGLTLRKGSGTQLGFDGVAGGAIHWSGDAAGTWLEISDCVFEENSTGEGNVLAVGGGAIWASPIGRVEISGTRFTGNLTEAYGGALLVEGEDAVILEGCEFESSHGIHFGSFLYVDMQQTSIHDCTFRSSCDAGTADPIGILIVSGPVVAIRNNRFLDEGSVPLATRLRLQGPGPSEQVRLEGNLFHHAMGADSAAAPVVELNYTVGDVQVRGNTFVRCGFDSRSGGLVFENNIVARGNVVLAQQGPGDAACNDIWKGALENGIPGFEVRDNISADPMFCSEPSGDFRIAYESPCEAANTGGCGTIGALGASCNVVRTKSLSWGAMRWSFRAEKP